MSEVDEIVGEFLVESHENLDQLDRDLVALEQHPGSRELVASIFRTIHTIKGTSGFLAFHHLEGVTHAGENLLARIRDGRIALTPARTSVLLEMVDAVRGLLATIEQTGGEGAPDHSALVARITAAQEEDAAAPEEPASTAPMPARRRRSAKPRRTSTGPADAIPAQVASPDNPAEATGTTSSTGDTVQRLGEILVAHGSAEPAAVHLALYEQEMQREDLAGPGQHDHDDAQRRSIADSTLRVDVTLLDSLMRLVGELVLTRNQVVSHAAAIDDAGLLRTTARLNLIASELQEGVMKTRMQPIDNVWNKLPRVVRDLGVSCGRQVRLEMDGRDTELDKTILEAIKDPLTHLVRNAVDHGIEPPEVRLSRGKRAEGVLRLRAYHEGGQVNIEVSDDGGGIDAEALAAKAVARGLVGAERVASMSQRDLLALVFAPGLSTREQVSNVSGRGVGMDVVKTNIENIGGVVDISSELGVGTSIRIKIPLTLAIIPAVTIRSRGERFAIPQVSLVELVQLDIEGRNRIEDVNGAPVYRLRDKLLPLVFLDEVLALPEEPDRDQAAQYIAVLTADGQQFGLVVDQVINTEEIVVKALSQQLKRIAVFSGATILGDGRVALILDVLALAQHAHVLTSERREATADDDRRAGIRRTESLLVVRLGHDRQVGIPLSDVTRLEEFPQSVLEVAGHREVVQYRDHILPLVRLSDVFGAPRETDHEQVHVVVHGSGGHSVGIVVEEILDITEVADEVEPTDPTDDLSRPVVVQDRVTELLDVRRAIRRVDDRLAQALESSRMEAS